MALTDRLGDLQLLTTEQLAQGCTRLVDSLPDLCLDHPRAPTLLADYLEHCCHVDQLTPAAEWRAEVSRLRAASPKPTAATAPPPPPARVADLN